MVITCCEEEARMKIYSVSTRHYYAFGALVSEELANKLKELPKVRWVLPDSYLDAENKDYGGEPFINGQAVPYDPNYHEEWVRNNTLAKDSRNLENLREKEKCKVSRTMEAQVATAEALARVEVKEEDEAEVNGGSDKEEDEAALKGGRDKEEEESGCMHNS